MNRLWTMVLLLSAAELLLSPGTRAQDVEGDAGESLRPKRFALDVGWVVGHLGKLKRLSLPYDGLALGSERPLGAGAAWTLRTDLFRANQVETSTLNSDWSYGVYTATTTTQTCHTQGFAAQFGTRFYIKSKNVGKMFWEPALGWARLSGTLETKTSTTNLGTETATQSFGAWFFKPSIRGGWQWMSPGGLRVCLHGGLFHLAGDGERVPVKLPWLSVESGIQFGYGL